VQRRHFAKFIHLGRAEIADADGANLSLAMQFAHGFGDLRDRRVRVRPVDLIEVDHVGLQTAQGILGLLDDPRLAGIAKRFAVLPVQSDFGGDERVLAAAAQGQRLSNDLFRTAEAVDGRGVDQIDAAVQRGMNGADRFTLVAAAPHPAADGPRSQRDARHANRGAGNVDEFHIGLKGLDAIHCFNSCCWRCAIGCSQDGAAGAEFRLKKDLCANVIRRRHRPQLILSPGIGYIIER
jgi:hypothetical protein